MVKFSREDEETQNGVGNIVNLYREIEEEYWRKTILVAYIFLVVVEHTESVVWVRVQFAPFP